MFAHTYTDFGSVDRVKQLIADNFEHKGTTNIRYAEQAVGGTPVLYLELHVNSLMLSRTTFRDSSLEAGIDGSLTGLLLSNGLRLVSKDDPRNIPALSVPTTQLDFR